jgi:hypothetical protein
MSDNDEKRNSFRDLVSWAYPGFVDRLMLGQATAA